MGKSNNRKDMHDFADDYEDYGDYRDMGSGMGRYDTDAESDMTKDMPPANTATKAKMSSHRAKQRAKRSNQTDR
jgi:hypothetical protein